MVQFKITIGEKF